MYLIANNDPKYYLKYRIENLSLIFKYTFSLNRDEKDDYYNKKGHQS